MAQEIANVDKIVEFLVYVIVGAVYAGVNAWKNMKRGEAFELVHFVKPLIVGGIAGVIMASRGDELTPTAFTAAMAIAVPIADQFLNKALPGSWGGYPGTSARQDRDRKQSQF